MNYTLKNLPRYPGRFEQHIGCIEIMDNVFGWSGCADMPKCKDRAKCDSGSRSGSHKDCSFWNHCVGGPARVIGSFDEFARKRYEESKRLRDTTREERLFFHGMNLKNREDRNVVIELSYLKRWKNG